MFNPDCFAFSSIARITALNVTTIDKDPTPKDVIAYNEELRERGLDVDNYLPAWKTVNEKSDELKLRAQLDRDQYILKQEKPAPKAKDTEEKSGEKKETNGKDKKEKTQSPKKKNEKKTDEKTDEKKTAPKKNTKSTKGSPTRTNIQ